MDPEKPSLESNEVLNTIARRRSVRRFDGRDVEEDLIRLLLVAANSAPSAHNQQSWRFIIVRGERKTKGKTS